MNSNNQTTLDQFKKLPDGDRTMLLLHFRSTMPVRYRDARLEFIDAEYRQVVLRVMDSFCTSNQRGILLAGEKGVGKTSALHVILKSYLMFRYLTFLQISEDQGGSPDTESAIRRLPALYTFVSQFQLVRQLRKYYTAGAGQQEAPAVITRPLVLIDDIDHGYEDQSKWNLALLDEYFEQRWQNAKLVCITTNKRPEDLIKWPGWGRIIDRLLDPIWMSKVWIDGDSKRTKEFLELRAAVESEKEKP